MAAQPNTQLRGDSPSTSAEDWFERVVRALGAFERDPRSPLDARLITDVIKVSRSFDLDTRFVVAIHWLATRVFFELGDVQRCIEAAQLCRTSAQRLDHLYLGYALDASSRAAKLRGSRFASERHVVAASVLAEEFSDYGAASALRLELLPI
jgi:hypothetical protein